MINILIKNIFKKAAFKLATDKNFRNKAKVVIQNTKELNSDGLLIKSLGKSVGRLKKKIKSIDSIRYIQRKTRLKNNQPIISLVGYTNSGKSTLFNQLTK